MQVASRGVSFSLAGWLWADLLLGLFTIFLAASAVASAAAPKQAGLDPKPLATRIPVEASALLSNDPARASVEQRRVASEVNAWLSANAPGRHAAIVFAYGANTSAADGDLMAKTLTDALTDATFTGTVMKPLHELITGDIPTTIAIEIYFDE